MPRVGESFIGGTNSKNKFGPVRKKHKGSVARDKGEGKRMR